MSSKDEFGDRMKSLELVETDRRFDQTLPIYARLDGRSFSKFTKYMNRPFDSRMTNCMIETTKYLVDKTNAKIGYTTSDEISLVWYNLDPKSDVLFSGKIQKMCSVLASMTAAKFAVEYFNQFGEMSKSFPHFDCRVIQMPDRSEAANMFLWREMDAQKNSVSMLARHMFSHNELQNKSTVDMIKMMRDKDVFLNQYPDAFRRGTWVRRIVEDRILTLDELLKIPEKYRPDPSSIVQRSSIVEIDMPDFVSVKNRIDVIFNNAKPIV